MLVLVATAARAEEAPLPPAALLASGLDSDPVLAGLERDTLARRPELARARFRAVAERERVPQAAALPDPTLTAGLQNDDFRRLEVGKMETSYYLVMLTQGIPFPGKLGLAREAASLAADAVQSEVSRAELSTEAEVRRGYVGLLRARGNLELLGRLEILWRQAEAVARSRYEVGQGSQADLLRAQLERTRLEQQRHDLEAAARTAVQGLNRLRGHPLDEPLEATPALDGLRLPEPPAFDALMRDARERSPELHAARLSSERADVGHELARRSLWPDFTLSAGVMPRGGSFPPLFNVSVGITLPVYAASRQLPAMDEGAARASAEHAAEGELQELLSLRTRERLERLGAAVRTAELYRTRLLVQSEAAVQSAVAQYQVGKVPFAAVLEALAGLSADRSGYLATLATGLELVIDQRALSLESPAAAPAASSTPAPGGM
jgi:cobalt-zinc-cadmium efflux system outer membrane protein